MELIRFLKRRPDLFDIEMVLTEKEIYYDEIYETGIPITVLKRRFTKYDPSLFISFLKICRRFRPDIIHAFGKMTTFYSIPAKIILGIPLVSSLISDSSRDFGSLSPYAFLLKTNVSFSDVVLSNSEAGIRAYNLKSPKTRVIYNGVDMRRFTRDFNTDEIKMEYGIKTRYAIVMVATFSVFKDHDLFLETARLVGRKRKDVSFVAVGDGPEWNRIRKRADDENISNVILPGKQKNVEQIVAACDIGVLCTMAEGVSNSIIEYMALGKPVIVTDMKGGSTELVNNEVTGYCIDRDPYVLAALIEKLLDNPLLRQSMGSKGRERIYSNFSIRRMGEDFQSLYNELLAYRKYVILRAKL